MPFRMLSENPAIASFSSAVAARDLQRMRDEEALRARMLFEQKLALDEALRRGIGEYYARQQPPEIVAAVQQPSPPVIPPSQPAAPAQQPYLAIPPENPVLEFQTERPRPALVVPPNAGSPAAGVVQPSLPPAAPVGRQEPAPSKFKPIMEELAKTPGAGAAMLQLFAHEAKREQLESAEARRMRQEGVRLFIEASRRNDVGAMRAIAQNYNLGIPPEVLRQRDIMASIAAGINIGKTLGITDDDKAIAFAKGYIGAMARTPDQMNAIREGLEEAQKVQPQPRVGWFRPSATGEIVGFDPTGKAHPTGVMAPPPGRGGGGGGGSRRVEYMKAVEAYLIKGGVHPSVAALYATGIKELYPLSEKQKWEMATKLFTQTKDQFGRRIFPTIQDARRHIDRAEQLIKQMGKEERRFRYSRGTGQLTPLE